MESTADIVQRLAETFVSYEEKKQLVSKLRQMASEQKGVLYIADLTKLFHTFELLLQLDPPSSTLPDLSLQLLELLNALTTSSDPETEIFLTKFLPALIARLGTESPALRKSIVGYITRYLSKTANYEAAFAAANRYGLEDSDWKVRVGTLEAVETWWKGAGPRIEGAEARKLVQNVIIRMKDGSEVVHKQAQNVLVSMTRALPEVMYKLTEKLPASLVSAYADLMVQEHIEQFKFHTPTKGITDSPLDEDVKQAYAWNGKSAAETAEWPEMDGLVFGVVPDYVIKELGPTANWKERAGAIDDLKEIVNSPGNVEKLEMYFSSFFKFIVRLLNDTNYKVTVTTLQIISIISPKTLNSKSARGQEERPQLQDQPPHTGPRPG